MRVKPGKGRFRLPVVAILLAAGVFLAVWFSRPAINRWRNPPQGRPMCRQNMLQIGVALKMYASENHGHLPDDLPGLLPTIDITSHCLVCPATDDTPAVASTSERIVAVIRLADTPRILHEQPQKQRHVSYIYRGKGQTMPLPANQVLVFEPLANHDGEGVNVLFGNGDVRFVDKKDVEALLNP